mgnify:CR=1 FL=1
MCIMKSKGFTLIELLAVIVLLAIIFSIVVVSVEGTINNSESKLSKSQIKNIEEAAESYYIEEGMDQNRECVNLSYLTNKGYLDGDQVKDPKTKKIMEGSVKISLTGNQYSYKYFNDACPYCTRVKEATTGNVPKGNYSYGDEYTCNVGDNYTNTFFVLENNADTVSLIMKENYTDSYVPKTLAWCTDGGTDNATCKNITLTGSSATTGKDYLGHIKSIFNKDGVEVSFPSASQIAIADGKNYLNSPSLDQTWLYDYMKNTIHPVSDVSGYWTSTPRVDISSVAWLVNSYGSLFSDRNVSNTSLNGVRPVITLSKSKVS